MVSSTHSYLAPAKINLTLKVIGRLPDGYHELDTWMHKVQLFDEIILQKGDLGCITLSCPDSDLPEDDSNLVVRAAKTFYSLIAETPALHIILKKNIPISAGLGGGSSDCATVLLGLNEQFGHPVSKERLLVEGKKLGADVPFFIETFVSARARGIGEILTELPNLPDCHILLVNPGIEVSTGWVFVQLRGKIPELEDYVIQSEKTLENDIYALTRDTKTYSFTRASAEGGLPNFFNDLEDITLARHPEIALIKKEILKYNAIKTLMSGSGSTVFGIFTNESDANNCKRDFQVNHSDWKLFLTKPFIA